MKRFIFHLVWPFLWGVSLTLFTVNYSSAQPIIGYSNFINSGLTSPVDIVNANDLSNRLFIVERGGIIKIHDGVGLLPTPFLNISTIITAGGERGLLSLAFHPDYITNGYFFVYYTNLIGDITIARYQVQGADPNQANAASGVILLTIPHPGFSNHNGGDLHFGKDGYLYFGTGDGGGTGDPSNNSQNGFSLLGKMIRIDVNNFLTPPYYTIPADNPYIGDPTVDDLIWTLGLRNPWRWSFDRSTNDMWIADVGQGAWEEVDFRSAVSTGGINYGWRCYEGNATYNTAGCLPQSSYISPIFVYQHGIPTGGSSITGGYVYRGTEYPLLQGYYICADYISGNLWLIYPDGAGGWLIRLQTGLLTGVVSFGEAEDGTMYAVKLNGNIYKIDVIGILPLSFLSFTGKRQTGYNELQWNFVSTNNTNRFIIEYSSTGTNWQLAGEVAAFPQAGNHQYGFRHYTNDLNNMFYRLQAIDNNNAFSYSPVISISGSKSGSIKIIPTLITNNTLQVFAQRELTGIRIIDNSGRLVLSKPINRQQGYMTIQLPALTSGIYLAQLFTATGNETVKIFIK